MIESMMKITLISPIELAERIIDFAFIAGDIHLIYSEELSLDKYSSNNIKEKEFRHTLAIFHDIDNFFESYKGIVSKISLNEQNKYSSFENIDTDLNILEQKIAQWKEIRATIVQKKTILNQYRNILKEFENLLSEVPVESKVSVRGISLVNINQEVRMALKEALKDATDDKYHLTLHQIKPKVVIGIIAYPQDVDERIVTLLKNLNVSEVILPHSSTIIETPNMKIARLQYEDETFETELKKSDNTLKDLYMLYQPIKYHKKSIVDKIIKYEGIKYLSITDNFVILQGYIPAKDQVTFNKLKDSYFKNDEFVVNVDKADEIAPLKVSNPHGIKEFELFTEMLPPPSYNSIDPTILMAIFFPLFYGFIVGDIGYGILIALFGLLIYFMYMKVGIKGKSIQYIGWIFFVSGLSAIFFGFLYGEFFGSLGIYFGIHSIWIERNKDLLNLLLITVYTGILHVILGFSLGVINANRVNNKKAMLYNGGFFLTDIGIVLLIASLFISLLKGEVYLIGFMGLIIVGVCFIIKAEGLIGITEIMSTIGNMLSYIRLMELGIASIYFAELANNLYFTVGGGIGGIIVAVTLHLMNLVFALFSPLIHSMRLHFVEFFPKFAQYGEHKYNPLSSNWFTHIESQTQVV